VGCHHTPAQPINPVVDRSCADVKLSSHIPAAAGGFQLIEQSVVVDALFGVIIDAKGLGRKPITTSVAQIALNTGKGSCGIATAFGIPHMGRRSVVMVDALRVGTEGGMFHRLLL
jgi:hypothetical protein